jgi:uncharacterized membrane protein (UPF0127 family)
MRLFMIVVLSACVLPMFAQSAPPVTRSAPEWAVAVFPSGASFTLELAATPSQQRSGYMFREHVPDDEGMLFLFAGPERHSIWMKNCKVSLDIIFLDANFRVIEIFSDAPPCVADEPCPSMQPMQVSNYVLEVAGGRAAAEKLRLGDTVVIDSEPPIR